MEMNAAQRSELPRPEAVAGRPVLLSIDKVGLSVPAAKGKLTIVEDISLDVREGEFVSIIGGSGC
jgi:ABC-type glutathione transport system ATPase component